VPEKPKENKTYAVTTKTTAQLLDDQDNLCDVLFADQNPSGAFSIQSYRWTASGESSKPDELPVGAGLENSAYFNGLTFPSISALGFKVYKQTIDNHEYNIMACGSVIFRSEGEEIEKFSDYSISYKAPGFAQAIRLNMCDNLQKMNYVSGNATISQYRFKCYGIE
jgi:hypothetical protein